MEIYWDLPSGKLTELLGNGRCYQSNNEYGDPQIVGDQFDIPVCTAQGGSGSFKDRKPIGGWLL